MKYFAKLILPKGIDAASADQLEHFAAELMRPFKMWEDDIPAKDGHWDHYRCCTKEWLDEKNIDCSTYESISANQSLLVFPVDKIPAECVTDSIVTPNKEWHRSRSTYSEEDHSWREKALAIYKSFTGHDGVLAYCHG